MFTFIINNFKVLFRHFIIARATHYYIITATRAALNSFIIRKTKSGTINTERYFVIKRTLFIFEKKFATISNRGKHC